jgi:hypothetical protein
MISSPPKDEQLFLSSTVTPIFRSSKGLVRLFIVIDGRWHGGQFGQRVVQPH